MVFIRTFFFTLSLPATKKGTQGMNMIEWGRWGWGWEENKRYWERKKNAMKKQIIEDVNWWWEMMLISEVHRIVFVRNSIKSLINIIVQSQIILKKDPRILFNIDFVTKYFDDENDKDIRWWWWWWFIIDNSWLLKRERELLTSSSSWCVLIDYLNYLILFFYIFTWKRQINKKLVKVFTSS